MARGGGDAVRWAFAWSGGFGVRPSLVAQLPPKSLNLTRMPFGDPRLCREPRWVKGLGEGWRVICPRAKIRRASRNMMQHLY